MKKAGHWPYPELPGPKSHVLPTCAVSVSPGVLLGRGIGADTAGGGMEAPDRLLITPGGQVLRAAVMKPGLPPSLLGLTQIAGLTGLPAT
jgi:hypothetical protein